MRAIFHSQLPVVSAVGHEIDVTLSDLVADVRAPTPSAAAELSLPDQTEVRTRLSQHQARLRTLWKSRTSDARQRLSALATNRVFRRPLDWLRDHAQHLDELDERGRVAMMRQLQSQRTALASIAARLESLSPLAVLARGYSLTLREDNRELIRNATQVHEGEQIVTQLTKGEFTSRVEEVRE